MKRVKAACICQVLHFMLKDGLEPEVAVPLAQREAESYKLELKQKKIKHRIVREEIQPDGSVVIEIIKQYSTNDTGKYLDV
ncbi:MAG: hypothetical protein IJY28_06725 [Clostridia bacterium]|nr:hypothetical protein [Clostridia bacterium]